MRYSEGFISLADVYRAYRKAKSDAFYEGMHFDAMAFAAYERHLDTNLRLLLGRTKSGSWIADKKILGGFSFAPKSLEPGANWVGERVHFTTVDSCEDWLACSRRNPGSQATASFRLIIRASVAYQIISALWILKVGHNYESALDPSLSFGNRLRRHRGTKASVSGAINSDCIGLFNPYFSAYRAWRSKGLQAMRSTIEMEGSVLAATMDVRRFYHNVSPSFLVRDAFHEALGFWPSDDQRRFTEDFIESIANWYRLTPDYDKRPAGALPVGLSASKVISNVLLFEFDKIVSARLSPKYYGRYVDDIFLVLGGKREIESGEQFLRWLSSEIPDRLQFVDSLRECHLKFSAPYAMDSEVLFAGTKQKIFSLKGRYGLDLVDQIEEQIRKQSSEHRMLPALPQSDGEMLAQALLATPDASLEADALRKADVISIRRLGFSLLLSDIESYARDLQSKQWVASRRMFYGLVQRHVITPRGIFDYFAYLNRVFGLMVACGDLDDASELVRRLARVAEVVRATAITDGSNGAEFEHCMGLYASGLMQAAIQASTVRGFRMTRKFMRLLREIRAVSPAITVPSSLARVRSISTELLNCDFGRRSYKEYWYTDNKKVLRAPSIPRSVAVRKVLRLGAVKRFRESIDRTLNPPYWPAIVFPTRPLTLPEITLAAPRLLASPRGLEQAVFALRGARIGTGEFLGRVADPDRPRQSYLFVPDVSRDVHSVAVVNFLTTDAQWISALVGKQDRGIKRYSRVNEVINQVLSTRRRIDYIAFPECSLPRRWAFSIASKLSKTGVSLLAGLENGSSVGSFRNDAFVSLSTSWPGYRTHLNYIQPKMHPAHHEAKELKKAKRKFYAHPVREDCRPIYVHGDHCFGLLLCSDLTNIGNRRHFQGCIDTLFVLEWNKDTKTFSSLIEATAIDLHAYVVQVNNRAYGDSRVRAPRDKDYERDVVRLKGGEVDYFVIAKLRVADLRRYQSSSRPARSLGFKPVPIGYQISELRRIVKRAKSQR